MAKCDFCGKSVAFGLNVSHSNRKTNRVWKPNIRKVKAGQTAVITSEAMPGEVFEGFVSSISMKGKTENGVTTYPVEIQIENVEGLLAGMNVRAEIFIEHVEGAVSIPAAALEPGNLVLVKGGEVDPGNPLVPSGYGYREVEVGVSDGAYVEIISGLSEGDSVILD